MDVSNPYMASLLSSSFSCSFNLSTLSSKMFPEPWGMLAGDQELPGVTKNSEDTYYLTFDQLYVSVLNAVHCTKEFLWWGLRSTLLYGCKGRYLKGLCSSLFGTRKCSASHEKTTIYLQNPQPKSILPARSAGAIVAQNLWEWGANVLFNLRTTSWEKAHVLFCLDGQEVEAG